MSKPNYDSETGDPLMTASEAKRVLLKELIDTLTFDLKDRLGGWMYNRPTADAQTLTDVARDLIKFLEGEIP